MQASHWHIMSNPVAAGRLSFDENLNILLEELVLARKWDRPSILLAVHRSKFGQQKAERALEERLKKLGLDVARITVDPQHSDIPHMAVNAPAAEQTVFFASNLDWGSGPDNKDAYRALNIYRELFVDYHLRIVLWLTPNEAATLARFAPDFWSFRHRVIEFSGQRIPRQVRLPSGVLLWDIQSSVDPFDTLDARIAVREELLGKLPHNGEARSPRIDLLYNLGYLYWAAGDAAQAAQRLNTGLELATGAYAGEARSSLLNGLAVLCYEANDHTGAADLLQQALQQSPEDASILMNLSVVSNALGRSQEAVTLAKRAVRLKPRDPRMSSTQGYVYAAVGKFDEALSSFGASVELAPRRAAPHAALAICYDFVGRTDDTAHELELARALARAGTLILIDIYEALLAGNAVSAEAIARSAVSSGRLARVDLQRDPNLSLLIDPAQLQDTFLGGPA